MQFLCYINTQLVRCILLFSYYKIQLRTKLMSYFNKINNAPRSHIPLDSSSSITIDRTLPIINVSLLDPSNHSILLRK